jgi:hypothetical protein
MVAKEKINKGKHIESRMTTFYKLEFVKWFLVLLLAIITYLIIAELIVYFYNPDISKAIEYAKKVSVNFSSQSFFPKPKERVLFLSSVFIFTTTIFYFYYVLNKLFKIFSVKTIQLLFYPSLIISIALIILISYLGLIASNPFANNIQNAQDFVAKSNMDFYFISTFIYNYFYLYLFILFPIILFNFLYDNKFSQNTLQHINKIKEILIYGFCILIIIIVFLISSFQFPYTYENKYDFNAVYYSIAQVYYGLPMLVDNFTNTYGLYPHFVVPILKLFGLSVLSFSTLMAFLIFLCFLFIFIFLRKIIESKLLILFGFTSILYNYYFYPHIITNFDAGFAGIPIRFILPCSLFLFSLLYLQNRSKLLYFISFIIFPFGILWNPEYGMVSLISLVIFYSFLELENQNLKILFRKIFIHIVFALSGLIITFLTYAVFIKIFYGKFPDLFKLFSTIKVFSLIGFNMLPMPPTFHPWMILALTFIIGLLNSIYHIINKNITSRSAIIFLLTITGIQTFSYYEGRSHNWTLIVIYPMAFLLLTIFADDLLKIIKKHKIFILPFALILFILSFSSFQTIYDYKKITDLVYERENKDQDKDENDRIIENGNFIKNLTIEKERILIFSATHYQGLYHSLSKTTSAINPGFTDLFFKSDYERVLSFLIKNEITKIFFEPEAFRFSDTRIPLILSTLYNITETNGKVLFLTKKKENTSEDFILKQDKNDIFHEQPDKNLSNRLSVSKGEKGKITLGKQFSIEVIFKPFKIHKSLYSNWATILCNAKDNNGLILQQRDTLNSQYIFAIPNQGIICPVIPNKWNYLSFEVNYNTIKAYMNGQLLDIQKINSTYQESDEPLFIGNYENLAGFFFGNIKEIKISKSPIDEKEINLALEKIKKL